MGENSSKIEENSNNETPTLEKEKKKKPVGVIIRIILSALILLTCALPVPTTINGKTTFVIGATALFGEDGILSNSLSFFTKSLGSEYEIYASLINISAYLLLAGAVISLIFSVIMLFTNKLDKIKRLVFIVIYLLLSVGVLGPTLCTVFTLMLGGITSSGFDASKILEQVKYCYPCLIWVICGTYLSRTYLKNGIKRNKEKNIKK